MNTFDLFLIPAAEDYKKFSEVINSLPKEYAKPSFPHVTLLNLVEADEKDLI